jgi:large subunit ribosomal protein L10
MNRQEKTDSVAAMRDELGRATVAVIADYRGLSAGDFDQLRRAVRGAKGRCRVAKNRLAKRAIEGTAYAHLEPLFRGPTALVLGFDDPVPLAKAAVTFSKEREAFAILGGGLAETPLPEADVRALAELPPHEVVMAQLLGLLQAPATRLVRLLNEPAAQLARLVKAIHDRAEGADAR